MAFDKVFQGDPTTQDVAAPGTHQSPAFGVDVPNKKLYVSAGNGWEAISAGSGDISGSGTTGFIPLFTTASEIGNSHINDGVTKAGQVTITEPTLINKHVAFGKDSAVDLNSPAYQGIFGFTPAVAITFETVTDPAVTLVGSVAAINIDATADNASGAVGAVGSVGIAPGNTKNYTGDRTGVFAGNYHSGTGNAGAMVGVNADVEVIANGSADLLTAYTMYMGNAGTVTKYYAFATQTTNDGTVTDLAQFWGLGNFNNSGSITNLYGLRLETPAPGGTITNCIGISIADQTTGTNKWAIKTGVGLVEFGDNLKIHGVIQSGIVYSVAGTALPSAATAGIGARAFVSDAVANTFNTVYVGSGANKVPVFSDGTNWLIG